VRVLLLLLVFAVPASAQEFTYRGFGQIQLTAYPQTTPQDDERIVAEALFRFEPAYRAADWLALSGSIDARVDTLAMQRQRFVGARSLSTSASSSSAGAKLTS
jgi:hypothetical protein